MSFDVFAISFREGKNAVADAATARAVLSRTSYSHDPQHGAYDVSFADGSQLEIYARGLHDDSRPFDSAMFALRGTSTAIGDFIFEFCRAAGCVLFPAMKPACVILPNEELAQHLPAKISSDADLQIISVVNGGELLAALEGGHATWKAYRERVAKSITDGTLQT